MQRNFKHHCLLIYNLKEKYSQRQEKQFNNKEKLELFRNGHKNSVILLLLHFQVPNVIDSILIKKQRRILEFDSSRCLCLYLSLGLVFS
jgi:hypothetical protein